MPRPATVSSRRVLGALLRDARKRQGLTQQQLADVVDLTQYTVSNAERGVGNLRLDTLFRLLAALKLELVIQPRALADGQLWPGEGD